MAMFTVSTVHPGTYLQCRSYAMSGPEGVILVDPGAGHEEAVILDSLQRLLA